MKKQLTAAQFNKLSKAKKAALVAQDVIDQIKAKRFIANSGKYIRPLEVDKFEGDIRQNFDKIKSCEVCALGSMLLSCTHLGNKLTTEDLDPNFAVGLGSFYGDNVKELFKSIFTPHQLLLIETAFEGHDDWKDLNRKDVKKEEKYFEYFSGADRFGADVLKAELTYEEAYKCEMFMRKYKNQENRLIAICNNIIKNKGKLII